MSNLSRRVVPRVDLEIFQHPGSGELYQVQRIPGQSIAKLIPLPEVEATGREQWTVDPLALVAVAVVGAVALAVGGYWLGWAAGSNSVKAPVVVPNTVVCSTTRVHGFLSSREEVQCR